LAALGLLFLLLSWLIPTYSAKKHTLESLKVSG
jgi:hypothetical protein